MNDVSATGPNDGPCLWVVGQGLIGGAIANTSKGQFAAPKFDWQAQDLSNRLVSAARAFADFTNGRAWSVVWAAGHGVVGVSPDEMSAETGALRSLLGGLRTNRPTGEGAVLVVSSAGAVYADSSNPPFDEFTPPAPITAYGRAKCLQEELVLGAADDLGVRSLVIRAANVYGRGQNMHKAQGLVSHLCQTAVTRQPTNLYVSGDTRRHYIWNKDLAALVVKVLARSFDEPAPFKLIKVAASAQSTTVAELVSLVRQVSKIPMRVSLGAEARTTQQAIDLRLKSKVWREVDASFQMPLIAGVKKVLDGFRFPQAIAR